jgi:hypothetical protein
MVIALTPKTIERKRTIMIDILSGLPYGVLAIIFMVAW